MPSETMGCTLETFSLSPADAAGCDCYALTAIHKFQFRKTRAEDRRMGSDTQMAPGYNRSIASTRNCMLSLKPLQQTQTSKTQPLAPS